MRRSFYHYIQTFKGGSHKLAETQFADHVSRDIQFPKHSEDYNEISSYLEMNVDYLSNMHFFDALWEQYVENNQ